MSPHHPSTLLQPSEGYGLAVDVWSCGVVLYQMMSGGHSPYNITATSTQMLHAHLKKHALNGIKRPHGMGEMQFPEAVLQLVRRMLTFDPAQRITCEEILQHPWVKANNGSINGSINGSSPSPSSSLSPVRRAALVGSPHRTPTRTTLNAPGISPKRTRSRTPGATHGTNAGAGYGAGTPTRFPSLTPNGGFSTHQPRYHDHTHGRVVSAMEELGFDREVIHGSIDRKVCNIVTATHYLLLRQLERDDQDGGADGGV